MSQNLDKRSSLRELVATVAIIALSVGCTSSVEHDVHTLSRGINGDPETLDPQKYSSTQAAEVLRDLGEGLIVYDNKGQLVPGAATSWRVLDDGRTYVFVIGKNRSWSDGSKVTAHDFVAGFRRLIDPQTASPSAMRISAVENAKEILKGIKEPSDLGVRAIGDFEFEIRLIARDPNFLAVLAHPSTFPICTSCTNSGWRFENDNEDRSDWISNGPYRLVEWDRGSLLILEKNGRYSDQENIFFSTVMYIVADPSMEVDRYRAGELDITSNVDSAKYGIVSKNYSDQLNLAPTLGLYYYGFNLKREPFGQNMLLRRALSLAIDRDLLVKHVTGRGEISAYSIVPDIVADYESRRMMGWDLPATNRESLARTLYKEAGFSEINPLELELRFNSLGGNRNIAVAVQAMWHEVLGVETTLIAEDFRVLLSNIRSAEETEVFRLSWFGDLDDPESFLRLFESDNPNNLTGYANDEVDTLLARATAATEAKSRLDLLGQVEDIVVNDHPIIPLYFFVSKHLVRRSIVGWESNSLDIHPSKYLARQ